MASHFTVYRNEIMSAHYFYRHPTLLVLCEVRIQNRVRNKITNLVRMAGADKFRSFYRHKKEKMILFVVMAKSIINVNDFIKTAYLPLKQISELPPEQCLAEIKKICDNLVPQDKFIFLLGGGHAVSLGLDR